MATIKKFEDLDVWQLARQLNIKIVPLLEKLSEAKNYDLKSQLDRSAGSVMDNISEGFERDGNREFIQFLAISKGSLGEVRSQLYRTLDRRFLEKEEHDLLQEECLLLAGKLGKFISYLNNSEIRGNKFKK
ncbi:MAG: four helix bundle protein [Bacteroidetes bacterium]|nr:four helix bundle protein [Bacteroidota bacterium]